ncbi:hypothetical protein [uncultured Kocuria sp.]|uniref:hypothetical protein n=1 Tax=uncultured Kocuria sp. TaxID=259305 RepID=UPI002596F3B5|nr:hypothetical protein [uncultured Kocuria sp.]MCT1367738.1 hypothetical protein [Rothia sp. p3-SID1597]
MRAADVSRETGEAFSLPPALVALAAPPEADDFFDFAVDLDVVLVEVTFAFVAEFFDSLVACSEEELFSAVAFLAA